MKKVLNSFLMMFLCFASCAMENEPFLTNQNNNSLSSSGSSVGSSSSVQSETATPKKTAKLSEIETQLNTIKALSTISLPEDATQTKLEAFYHELSLGNLKISNLEHYVKMRFGLEILCDARRRHNNKGFEPYLKIDEVQITKLILGENMLTELPGQLGQLVYLKEIDLSHNQFKRIPLPLKNCRALKLLDLCHNKIEKIEEKDIKGGFSKLTCLYLTNNKLTQVPTVLYGIKGLRHMYLQENPLTDAEQYKKDERLHLSELTQKKSETQPVPNSPLVKFFGSSPKVPPKQEKK